MGSTSQGPTSFGTLVHLSNPLRIDWCLIPSQESQQNDVALPVLGPFAQVMVHFFTLMSQWIGSENIPRIKRIALGSILLLPADTKVSAYKQLDSFLPQVQIDIENSYDFQ